MATSDGLRHLAYDKTRPPEYAEVVSSTRYPILQTSGSIHEDVTQGIGGAAGRSVAPKWKLKFADFTPHLTANNQARTMTSFDKIIDRANMWLKSNENAHVLTCETVTWCAEDLRQLNDTDVTTIKFKKGNVKKMYLMRGLRVWLTPRRVYSDAHSTTVGVREFTADVLDIKSLENFDVKTLIRQANSELLENPIQGRIVNIDSALRPTRADTSKNKLSIGLHDTYWTDGAKINRKYIPVIRVFYIHGLRDHNMEIGVTDVLPRMVRESGKHKYEDLESLMIQASKWIQNQPHINVTNLQTVTYRRRGFIQGVGMPVFWASPDSEETCVRCLRIAYTKPKAMFTLRVLSTQDCLIRKRTFAPRKIHVCNDSGSNNSLPEDELKYQSFTRTVEEISQWLTQIDAEVLCTETLHQQINDGRQNMSPDSTLVRQTEEKSREFITLIRIFLRTHVTSPFLNISTPASFYVHSGHRPFWNRASRRPAICHVSRQRYTHVIIIFVISAAILIAGTVIVLVVAVGRRWI